MKRIAMSRRVRHMGLYLQWLLWLMGVPVPGLAQGVTLQMEMRANNQMGTVSGNAPAADCRSAAFC